jgi:hypothetical protein
VAKADHPPALRRTRTSWRRTATMSQATPADAAAQTPPTPPPRRRRSARIRGRPPRSRPDQAALKLAALAAVPGADLLFMADPNAAPPSSRRRGPDRALARDLPPADPGVPWPSTPSAAGREGVREVDLPSKEGPVVQQALEGLAAQWQRCGGSASPPGLFTRSTAADPGGGARARPSRTPRNHEEAVKPELAASPGKQRPPRRRPTT